MAAGMINLLVSHKKKAALVVVAEKDYAYFMEELIAASNAGIVLEVKVASNENKMDKSVMHLAIHVLPAYFCGFSYWSSKK